MEEVFDGDALDYILFHKFRDDMPNMAAAWKILRVDARRRNLPTAAGARQVGARERTVRRLGVPGRLQHYGTVYPEGAVEIEDGVLSDGWRLLMRILSKAWRA